MLIDFHNSFAVCLLTFQVQVQVCHLGYISRDLHWLPVGHRITYKLCLTTCYLSELISHYFPSRSFQYKSPPGITSNFSSQAFSVSAPSTSNSLPAHIRSIDTLSTFKRHLKFHLFQSAFTV